MHSDIVKFPLDALCKILNTEKLACLFGYGVSEGNAPHLFDLQCGIAATINAESNKINPFVSHSGYRLFKQWLDWRMACIKADKPSDSLKALCLLTQTFKTITATQNVDGLHRSLPFENVYELYGCIQEMVMVDTPYGQQALPDVEMFERHSKAAIRDAFAQKMTGATLLIEVATEERLHPYNHATFKNLNIPRLCLTDTHLAFYNQSQWFKLNYAAYQTMLRKRPEFQQIEASNLASVISSLLTISGL